ncbi:hypothetical protein JAAARDRAFT_35491 [Jaapia argillacea MUCL 33604]|uniref:Uncharacterized protein n=1 Tax=Jaapia argillacea MUCL 33604 TaxID=933084 RepID=A0A067Q5D2_9AGAM|nr:hypothetical protein JAAARDRAFT_35491 [Jaapia argillacea MUCL 33604]
MSASSVSIISTPRIVWDWYVQYLVFYESGSWVDKTASTFRVLAFLLVSPFMILTLLDVASYLIARTLGVIDDTKASTSDTTEKTEAMLKHSTPTILVQDESSTPASESETNFDLRPSSYNAHNTADQLHMNAAPEEPKAYFVTPTEESMKLSGVGVFSPAASRSPSPTIERRTRKMVAPQTLGSKGGQDVSWQSSLSSSSGDSTFTMVERESSPEDAFILRRNKRRT